MIMFNIMNIIVLFERRRKRGRKKGEERERERERERDKEKEREKCESFIKNARIYFTRIYCNFFTMILFKLIIIIIAKK